MNVWVISVWDRLRGSFWFVPSLFGLAAVVLSVVLPLVDRALAWELERWSPWLITTAPAARLTLSSIAGAMITVTGVVFSITVVALGTTASQFGSRLLRNLMDHPTTQAALGILVATSLYSLLVLRVIREDGSVELFVPHLSVSVGVLLAIAGVWVFIVFIHKIAMRMQAPNLVRDVARELRQSVERMYPEQLSAGEDAWREGEVREQVDRLGGNYAVVRGDSWGYLQGIDEKRLLELAAENDLVVHVPVVPGDFISPETARAHIWPAAGRRDAVAGKLRTCFLIGKARTPRQDIGCSINELVEVAVRALSPGINDPFTAMTCLDYLGATLVELAGRKPPSPLLRDDRGRLRVVLETVTFSRLIRDNFHMILHYGASSPSVVLRVVEVLGKVADAVGSRPAAAGVAEAVERVRGVAAESLRPAEDREAVERLCEVVLGALQLHPVGEGVAG